MQKRFMAVDFVVAHNNVYIRPFNQFINFLQRQYIKIFDIAKGKAPSSYNILNSFEELYVVMYVAFALVYEILNKSILCAVCSIIY